MALDGIAASVNNWLQRQHVTVLDEWVRACVEWLKSEDTEALNNLSEVQHLVYDQWLDSNLADVGTPCLPNGISQQQKGLLNGNYILQINSLRDVSTPAYGQMLKLRGQENENATVTATQQTQSRFEPKSSRMLMLQLTDGHQNLQAMEFQPVPGLSTDTSPGTKIQVCGSVQCRLGVLLLSPQNVKVLGGEVDALVESNNRDAILAQALGQPTIPLDQQRAQPTQQDHSLPNQLPQQHQQQVSHLPQQQASNHVIDLTEDRPVNNAFPGIQDTKHRVVVPKQQAPTGIIVKDDPFIDDFDDDDDFDEVMLQGLQEIELQQEQALTTAQTAHVNIQQQQQPGNNTSAPIRTTKYDSSVKTEIKNTIQQNNSLQEAQRQPRTFLGQNLTTSTSNRITDSTGNRFQQPIPSSHQNGNRENTLNSARLDSSNSYRSYLNGNPPGYVEKFESISGSSTGHQGGTFLNAKPEENRSAVVKQQPEFDHFERPGTSGSTFGHSNIQQRSKVFQPYKRTDVKSEPGCTSDNMDQNMDENPAVTIGFQSDNKANSGSGFGSKQFQSAVTARGVKTELLECGQGAQRSTREGSAREVSTGSVADDREIMMAKRRRLFSGQNSGVTSSTSMPYSSLLLAIRKWEAKECCVMNIKGFIMTLVSSLTCKKGWNVIAKINDGTASMDVDLGNEVLTKLIGFSVLELMQMRKAANTAGAQRQTELKAKMQQGLEKCQQALINISCIMTLEIRPEYERPRVLAFREINNSDCIALIHQL